MSFEKVYSSTFEPEKLWWWFLLAGGIFMPGLVRTMQVDHCKTIRNSFRSFQEGNHSLIYMDVYLCRSCTSLAWMLTKKLLCFMGIKA